PAVDGAVRSRRLGPGAPRRSVRLPSSRRPICTGAVREMASTESSGTSVLTTPRIVVDSLGKSFILHHTHTLKDRVVRAFRSNSGPSSNEFTALKDVSFTVDDGEAVALLGL